MTTIVCIIVLIVFFFFQAEDGIRDKLVTGVQTCALPISTVGLHSRQSGWNYDASFTLGFNSQDYTVLNSHNRSNIKDTNGVNVYRENSPINFKPGASKFSHQVWNLDVAKGLTDQLSLGVGSEFRRGTYEIDPGDKASWDGVGADSYAGNRAENSGT